MNDSTIDNDSQYIFKTRKNTKNRWKKGEPLNGTLTKKQNAPMWAYPPSGLMVRLDDTSNARQNAVASAVLQLARMKKHKLHGLLVFEFSNGGLLFL